MQVENLYTEAMGVKMYYETLESSVKEFRENPTGLTMAEATSIYTLSFNHINIFGELQEKIEEFCFTGPVPFDKTNTDKADTSVKRCFKMFKGIIKDIYYSIKTVGYNLRDMFRLVENCLNNTITAKYPTSIDNNLFSKAAGSWQLKRCLTLFSSNDLLKFQSLSYK